jgi:hypothetical protein
VTLPSEKLIAAKRAKKNGFDETPADKPAAAAPASNEKSEDDSE